MQQPDPQPITPAHLALIDEILRQYCWYVRQVAPLIGYGQLADLPMEALRQSAKIVGLGGHCDCEVLLNVDPDTWAESSEEEVSGPDLMGEAAWQQLLSDLLIRSGYDQA